MSKADPKPGQTVFFGDSNIDYWDGDGDSICSNCGCGDVWRSVPQIFGTTAYNVAVEGTTCKSWVESGALDDWVLSKFKPSSVVLHCGQNDMLLGAGCGTMFGEVKGSTVDETFRALSHIVDKIGAAAGAPRIFYFSPVNDPASKKDFDKYREYNTLVKTKATALATSAKQANKLPPLVFIDTFEGFFDVDCQSSCFGKDDMHMTNTGYSYWKDWLQLAVNATGADAECVIWRNGVCTQKAAALRKQLDSTLTEKKTQGW